MLMHHGIGKKNEGVVEINQFLDLIDVDKTLLIEHRDQIVGTQSEAARGRQPEPQPAFLRRPPSLPENERSHNEAEHESGNQVGQDQTRGSHSQANIHAAVIGLCKAPRQKVKNQRKPHPGPSLGIKSPVVVIQHMVRQQLVQQRSGEGAASLTQQTCREQVEGPSGKKETQKLDHLHGSYNRRQ